MKKVLLIILFSFFIFLNIKAQQLYFCKTHTTDGKPIDAQIEWTIKPWGETLEVLFDNEGKTIDGSYAYIFIDREVNGKYEPFDSKAVKLKYGSTWISYAFKFVELGRYKAYFINSNQDTLGSERLTLKLEESFGTTSKKLSSIYYDRIRLVFCERVIAGRIINEKSYVSMSKDGGNVHVYLISKTPLNSNKLVVDIWKQKENSFDYEQYIESKKYAMLPSWPDVFFRYRFKTPGNYKVAVYNSDEVLIKSGFIKVIK